MKQKQKHIYGLIDPREGQIRYVGATQQLKERLKDHLTSAYRSSSPKRMWMRELLTSGLQPEMIVLETVPYAFWEEAERYWIAKMRERGVPLLNVFHGGLDGGRGIPKSPEHRAKIGQAHKGRKFSATTRAKMSAARRGWRPSPELTRIQREKCKGEGNGRARLTEEQVIEIRRRYAAGGICLHKLAEDYPVTFSAIHRIVTRQTWKHVP